jgi:hypothetical protein
VLVLPACNTEAMNLAEIAAEVAPGKHAVLVVGMSQAGERGLARDNDAGRQLAAARPAALVYDGRMQPHEQHDPEANKPDPRDNEPNGSCSRFASCSV